MALRSISHWGMFDVPEHVPGGIVWLPNYPSEATWLDWLQAHTIEFITARPVTPERTAIKLRERLWR
jgi:hypothetical protein